MPVTGQRAGLPLGRQPIFNFRGYLERMLESVITGMVATGRPWFATHAQIADLANTSPSASGFKV